MNTLLKRATEIQLGPKNKSLLLQQARSLSEQVDKVDTSLKKEYVYRLLILIKHYNNVLTGTVSMIYTCSLKYIPGTICFFAT